MISRILTIALFLFLILFLILAVSYQIRENTDFSDPLIDQLKLEFEQLHPIVKSLEFYVGKKSYTINKKKVYLCIRDEKDRYYSRNILAYVLIHEISHALCKEVGHTDSFYDTFNKMLKRAEYLGLYDPSIPMIDNYCNYSKED